MLCSTKKLVDKPINYFTVSMNVHVYILKSLNTIWSWYQKLILIRNTQLNFNDALSTKCQLLMDGEQL